MDVISQILDSLKLGASFYFDTRFGAPWSVCVPAYKQVARFHYVTQGSCWVSMGDEAEPVALRSGDFVLIPHGSEHILGSSKAISATPLENALQNSDYSGQGTWVYGDAQDPHPVCLICGHFQFDEKFQHPLIKQLPQLLVVPESRALDFSWFTSALKLLNHETQAEHMGQAAIIRRLSEIVFIQMIRVWAKSSELPEGFLRAMQDRGIGQSLADFHKAPQYRWSVERLASAAGMSRTAYAQRFRLLSGVPPMHYVTDWRMQYAGQLLLDTSFSIEQIAERAGYQSLPAFNRVFKKHIGVGPGYYRRHTRNEPEVA